MHKESGMIREIAIIFLLLAAILLSMSIDKCQDDIEQLRERVIQLEKFATASDVYHMEKDASEWLNVTKGGDCFSKMEN